MVICSYFNCFVCFQVIPTIFYSSNLSSLFFHFKYFTTQKMMPAWQTNVEQYEINLHHRTRHSNISCTCYRQLRRHFFMNHKQMEQTFLQTQNWMDSFSQTAFVRKIVVCEKIFQSTLLMKGLFPPFSRFPE